MRKILIKSIILVLALHIVFFGLPTNKTVLASEINESEGIQFIIDTEEKSEYLLQVDGQTLRYIETVEDLGDIVVIHTKVYNNETNELLQDFSTKIEGTQIVDQEVEIFEILPSETNDVGIDLTIKHDPITEFDMRATSSSIISNRSMISYFGISYTTNYLVDFGYANYADLGTKKVNLKHDSATNRANYNEFTRAVDGMVSHESSTIAGWIIQAVSGGGLTIGTLFSWATAKVILKNIAGPVAFATNAYALSMWVYHYNEVNKSYYALENKY
ncbi:hypothetical protein GMD78_08945 [Ornithinibacillus sp. L9]|uniref:Uncharacterized protein n=1 Tax=Ornithinibacillus caprae TaxID=2678566 RepID=A0A6N8FMF9_9BACI|nr:hypothetical protein [Ornithinibacillus caprae]MUK88518.1 hypothetical protein [Ornithinibacillus caprae]